MKVVSNASPRINLARIGQLDVVPQLFERLLLPEAVWQEVVENGQGQPGADEIRRAAWIERASVSNRQLVHSLRQDLDAGEAEAIALAVEIQADWLLMDERLGRETARHFGLRCVGLVGILSAAKAAWRYRGVATTSGSAPGCGRLAGSFDRLRTRFAAFIGAPAGQGA